MNYNYKIQAQDTNIILNNSIQSKNPMNKRIMVGNLSQKLNDETTSSSIENRKRKQNILLASGLNMEFRLKSTYEDFDSYSFICNEKKYFLIKQSAEIEIKISKSNGQTLNKQELHELINNYVLHVFVFNRNNHPFQFSIRSSISNNAEHKTEHLDKIIFTSDQVQTTLFVSSIFEEQENLEISQQNQNKKFLNDYILYLMPFVENDDFNKLVEKLIKLKNNLEINKNFYLKLYSIDIELELELIKKNKQNQNIDYSLMRECCQNKTNISKPYNPNDKTTYSFLHKSERIVFKTFLPEKFKSKSNIFGKKKSKETVNINPVNYTVRHAFFLNPDIVTNNEILENITTNYYLNFDHNLILLDRKLSFIKKDKEIV